MTKKHIIIGSSLALVALGGYLYYKKHKGTGTSTGSGDTSSGGGGGAVAVGDGVAVASGPNGTAVAVASNPGYGGVIAPYLPPAPARTSFHHRPTSPPPPTTGPVLTAPSGSGNVSNVPSISGGTRSTGSTTLTRGTTQMAVNGRAVVNGSNNNALNSTQNISAARSINRAPSMPQLTSHAFSNFMY